jgi:hypothetical protein
MDAQQKSHPWNHTAPASKSEARCPRVQCSRENARDSGVLSACSVGRHHRNGEQVEQVDARVLGGGKVSNERKSAREKSTLN